MLGSVIASPMLAYRALELGREFEVPLPTTAVTNEFLTAANGMGIGDKDFAVLFDVLAAMAGVHTGVLA